MKPETARFTRSPEETEGLGLALAPALRAGDLVSLTGPLGSGKTRFVVGLARGLACKARVRSPSFAIVNEYHGRILLVHLDLYRLGSGEVEELGFEEYAERAALVVEWGEKLRSAWRAEALCVTFAFGERIRDRRISAGAEAGRGLELLAAWQGIGAPAGSRDRA